MRNYIFLLKMERVKFNIGSGIYRRDNEWIHTDRDTLDITRQKDWDHMLFNLRIDNIMAEHVWEHLSEEDSILANNNCYKYLRKNGVLRIAVPDGYNPNPHYIDYVRPGGTGAGADDHKILYNYVTLKSSLEGAGFEVQLLEYWDEKGEFHFINWTDEAGHIMRSRRYDKRNQEGNLNYTSLIVDAVKL
jgi:predicted SAM-dependent methyltransferase